MWRQTEHLLSGWPWMSRCLMRAVTFALPAVGLMGCPPHQGLQHGILPWKRDAGLLLAGLFMTCAWVPLLGKWSCTSCSCLGSCQQEYGLFANRGGGHSQGATARSDLEECFCLLQMEKDETVSDSSPHIANIGRLVEVRGPSGPCLLRLLCFASPA